MSDRFSKEGVILEAVLGAVIGAVDKMPTPLRDSCDCFRAVPVGFIRGET
jgi:hypothetical protein